MDKIFAPSLLRALVSRNVLVSVLALVVVVGVAIYESYGLILGQFADESAILADVAQNELGSPFLKNIKTRSDADLALIWNGQVRASTVDFGANATFPSVNEVDAQPNDVLIQNITANGRNYYGIFRVVRSQRQNPGLLAVLVPTAGVEQAQRTLIGVLVLLGLALVGVVTLLAYRTARQITVPLGNLAAAAQRIEAGDLAARVQQVSAHEIGTLERAFDTMAASLYERERAQRECLDAGRAVNR